MSTRRDSKNPQGGLSNPSLPIVSIDFVLIKGYIEEKRSIKKMGGGKGYLQVMSCNCHPSRLGYNFFNF